MSGSIWLVFAFVLIATVALFVVIVVIARGAQPRSGHDGVRRVRRVIFLARVVAAVLAVRVVMDVSALGQYGQGLALAPVVVAIVWVIGGIAAETFTRSTLRGGGATLEVRSVRRYLPLRATVLLGAGIVLVVAAGIVTSALADPDGRSLSHSCGPNCWSIRSPWAGTFYLAPLAVALLVLLALVAINVRLVVSRPRGHLAAADATADDATRSAAVAASLSVVALAVAATAAGLVVFGMAAAAFDPHAPLAARLVWLPGLAGAVLAGISAVGLVVAALAPRPAELPVEA